MKKKRIIRYRDGYISVLEELPQKNDFNAKQNATVFKKLVVLPFETMSARIQDFELMDVIGKNLELKVKTPNCGLDLNKKYHVMVNNDISSIYTLSHFDVTKEEYFLYLSKVGVKKNVSIE